MKRNVAKATANAPYTSGAVQRAKKMLMPKLAAEVSPWSSKDSPERTPQIRSWLRVKILIEGGGTVVSDRPCISEVGRILMRRLVAGSRKISGRSPAKYSILANRNYAMAGIFSVRRSGTAQQEDLIVSGNRLSEIASSGNRRFNSSSPAGMSWILQQSADLRRNPMSQISYV